ARPAGGETGTVYDRFRAAKTFKGQDQQAVVDELSNWIMLHHRNILPLIKISRLDFQIAALMEMRKATLADLLAKHKLEWPTLCSVLLQICDALAYAFKEHGLAHLDIKPENVLIDEFAGNVQVSDWGISRLAVNGRISGSTGGTLVYCGPERFQKCLAIGPVSDIFSIGMLGIFALTLDMPYAIRRDEKKFGAPLDQVRSQICSGEYFANATRVLARQPSAIRQLLLQCINPDPRRRIDNYDYLRSTLEGLGK
ncbi:MAG: protein kinase domain-containing protein, partial [Ktedonobacteraceae bacterium]